MHEHRKDTLQLSEIVKTSVKTICHLKLHLPQESYPMYTIC